MPSQNISYLSCHDDWTLWDKLVCSMDPNCDFRTLQTRILRANRMAATINFCCQGHLFFLSGEEFGRTKGGVKNSYKSSPEINCLDWGRAWANRDLVDHYRGLIELRMQLSAFCDKSERAAESFVSAVDLAPDCVGISGVNNDDSSRWDKLLLLCNAGTHSREVPLPAGIWQLLADDTSTFRWQKESSYRNKVEVPAVAALVFGRISK